MSDNKINKEILVKLLQNYKVLFDPRRSGNNIRQRKLEAFTQLADEYNEKYQANIQVHELVKKMSDIKCSIKKKNYQNLKREHKIEYLEWERKFLELWHGGAHVMVLPNKMPEAKKRRRAKMLLPRNNENLKKNNPHFNTKSNFRLDNGKDNKYKRMSFYDLQRVISKARLKTLKAQEDSVYATEKLKMYKLSHSK